MGVSSVVDTVPPENSPLGLGEMSNSSLSKHIRLPRLIFITVILDQIRPFQAFGMAEKYGIWSKKVWISGGAVSK